tara:strand:+ start:544 stop:1422 length:879 start_codon:yes stop_codon:yes gene_type:complete
MFYKEIKKLKKSELQELLATTLQQKATLERANCSLTNELYKNIDERDLEIDDLGHSITELIAENKENVSELNNKYSQLNKWWSDRYNDLQNDIINTSQELLETENELVEARESLVDLADSPSETELYDLIDSRDEEIDQLKTELEESENLLIESREDSEVFRTQNITLHKRLDCLLDNIDRLETENNIHMREKSEARDQRDRAQKDLVDIDYKLSKLEAEGSTPKNLYIHEIETIFVDSGELHLIADEDKNLVFNCSNLVQDLATINDLVIQEAKRDLKDSIHQIKQLTKDI